MQMHNHNDTMITTTQSFEKSTSHFIWKGCAWEGVGDRTELQHIDPHSIGYNCVSFPFSWAAQLGAWGPTLLGAGFLYRILSSTGLVSRLTDFLSSPSYIIVPRPPSSCGRHNFGLIQTVHGQGYNILIIPRPDAPVIYIGAFPVLTARPGRRSIYNTTISRKFPTVREKNSQFKTSLKTPKERPMLCRPFAGNCSSDTNSKFYGNLYLTGTISMSKRRKTYSMGNWDLLK